MNYHGTLKKILTDELVKAVAVVAFVLFAIGLLIDNVHLAQQGFFAPAPIQPRQVFVGFTYLLYLWAPILLTIGPHAYLRYGVSVNPNATARRQTPLLPIATSLLIVLGVACFATSVHYFVVDLPTKDLGIDIVLGYWRYYAHPWSWIQWVTIYLPCWLVYYMLLPGSIITRTAIARAKKAVMLLVPLGTICSLMGYVYFVFPNIEHSVGGGQPALVEITIASSEADAIDPTKILHKGPMLEKSVSDAETLGPLLLWAESDQFLYVSPLASLRAVTLTFAIPVSSVRSLRYLPDKIWINHGMPVELIGVRGKHTEVPILDALIPLQKVVAEGEEAIKKVRAEASTIAAETHPATSMPSTAPTK